MADEGAFSNPTAAIEGHKLEDSGIIELFKLRQFFFPAYEHGNILYLNTINLITIKYKPGFRKKQGLAAGKGYGKCPAAMRYHFSPLIAYRYEKSMKSLS
jgi:hypothetical protein